MQWQKVDEFNHGISTRKCAFKIFIAENEFGELPQERKAYSHASARCQRRHAWTWMRFGVTHTKKTMLMKTWTFLEKGNKNFHDIDRNSFCWAKTHNTNLQILLLFVARNCQNNPIFLPTVQFNRRSQRRLKCINPETFLAVAHARRRWGKEKSQDFGNQCIFVYPLPKETAFHSRCCASVNVYIVGEGLDSNANDCFNHKGRCKLGRPFKCTKTGVPSKSRAVTHLTNSCHSWVDFLQGENTKI